MAFGSTDKVTLKCPHPSLEQPCRRFQPWPLPHCNALQTRFSCWRGAGSAGYKADPFFSEAHCLLLLKCCLHVVVLPFILQSFIMHCNCTAQGQSCLSTGNGTHGARSGRVWTTPAETVPLQGLAVRQSEREVPQWSRLAPVKYVPHSDTLLKHIFLI